jgi:hypothetical protein
LIKSSCVLQAIVISGTLPFPRRSSFHPPSMIFAVWGHRYPLTSKFKRLCYISRLLFSVLGSQPNNAFPLVKESFIPHKLLYRQKVFMELYQLSCFKYSEIAILKTPRRHLAVKIAMTSFSPSYLGLKLANSNRLTKSYNGTPIINRGRTSRIRHLGNTKTPRSG